MLEWIVSSSVLAALMIVLRYLLRGHISLRLQYSIWLILLLRLLLPVSLGTSPVSVANALPQAEVALAEQERTVAAYSYCDPHGLWEN